MLKNYSRYKSANSTDLWTILNQETRRLQVLPTRMNVVRIMKPWTHIPGYPLVQVTRNPNGTLQLTQVTTSNDIITVNINLRLSFFLSRKSLSILISRYHWISLSFPFGGCPSLWLTAMLQVLPSKIDNRSSGSRPTGAQSRLMVLTEAILGLYSIWSTAATTGLTTIK